MLKDQPDSTFREEMTFQLGNACFEQAKWDDAAKDYEKYRTEFADGQHFEEAVYRFALCSVFAGKYEEAMKLISDYIAKYPRGNFISDAKYRLAMCKYAASLYDEVIADCRRWQVEFKNDPMTGEVLALQADALAATTPPNDDEAIDSYIRSYKAATTDQVLNYSIFAAQKLMQKKGEWERLGSMFEEFVKDKPENPNVVTAVFWIGKAKTHEGKVDEAKQFVAATVKKYIADPNRDSVEQLLSQLAQLCVRKKKPAEPAASETPVATAAASPAADVAASTPVPTPTPEPTPTPAPEIDPGVELEQLLGGAETNKSPTAKARVLYAKSELARLRRQPAEQEKNLAAIAQNFKADDLSPMLLAFVGDYLLTKGDVAKAEPLFQRLMDDFPKSDIVDFAYNGLGEIAFQRKQYDAALKLFSDAIDKGFASQKLKDVTVGKAKCLLALGKLDEAKKVFEQVAAAREWRGDATAFSVYSIGEIFQKQGKLPEAIAQYQRVYVAYQKFLPWVAKAYTQSGECFEKLGKTQEALNTYREMLRNDKLAKFPETEVARKRLEEAGQG
jgi:TolA-binding protein